jgi:hypothetical protein
MHSKVIDLAGVIAARLAGMSVMTVVAAHIPDDGPAPESTVLH